MPIPAVRRPNSASLPICSRNNSPRNILRSTKPGLFFEDRWFVSEGKVQSRFTFPISVIQTNNVYKCDFVYLGLQSTGQVKTVPVEWIVVVRKEGLRNGCKRQNFRETGSRRVRKEHRCDPDRAYRDHLAHSRFGPVHRAGQYSPRQKQ